MKRSVLALVQQGLRLALGRHEDAFAGYGEAARRGPSDAETELNRGNVLQKLGRLEESLASRCLAKLTLEACNHVPA
jgi:hypothetical protein